MNAGCFGYEIQDILLSIQAVDKAGNIINIQRKDINFKYRESDLPENLIFLSASFKGKKERPENIKDKMMAYKLEKEKLNQRELKQVAVLLKTHYRKHKKRFGN